MLKAEVISDIDSLYMKFEGVSLLSVLALIYRAIPPRGNVRGSFTSECTETARAALEAHETCMASMREGSESLKRSYMHWYETEETTAK